MKRKSLSSKEPSEPGKKAKESSACSDKNYDAGDIEFAKKLVVLVPQLKLSTRIAFGHLGIQRGTSLSAKRNMIMIELFFLKKNYYFIFTKI